MSREEFIRKMENNKYNQIDDKELKFKEMLLDTHASNFPAILFWFSKQYPNRIVYPSQMRNILEKMSDMVYNKHLQSLQSLGYLKKLAYKKYSMSDEFINILIKYNNVILAKYKGEFDMKKLDELIENKSITETK